MPTDVGEELAQFVSDPDIDTRSPKMEVDHVAVQLMEIIYGDLNSKPCIPTFVNSVAPPFWVRDRSRR